MTYYNVDVPRWPTGPPITVVDRHPVNAQIYIIREPAISGAMDKGPKRWYEEHRYFNVRRGRFVPCRIPPGRSLCLLLGWAVFFIIFVNVVLYEYSLQDLETVDIGFFLSVFLAPIILGVVYAVLVAANFKKVTFYFHIPMKPPIPRLLASASAGMVVGLMITPLVLVYSMPELFHGTNIYFVIIFLLYILPVTSVSWYSLIFVKKGGLAGFLFATVCGLAFPSMFVRHLLDIGISSYHTILDQAYFCFFFLVIDIVVYSFLLFLMRMTPDQVVMDLPTMLRKGARPGAHIEKEP